MNTPTLLQKQQQQQLVAHALAHTQLHSCTLLCSANEQHVLGGGGNTRSHKLKCHPVQTRDIERKRKISSRRMANTHAKAYQKRERGEKERVMGSIGAAVAAASVPSASASEPKYLHKFFAVSELRQLKGQRRQQLGPLFFIQSTTFTDHDQ